MSTKCPLRARERMLHAHGVFCIHMYNTCTVHVHVGFLRQMRDNHVTRHGKLETMCSPAVRCERCVRLALFVLEGFHDCFLVDRIYENSISFNLDNWTKYLSEIRPSWLGKCNLGYV